MTKTLMKGSQAQLTHLQCDRGQALHQLAHFMVTPVLDSNELLPSLSILHRLRNLRTSKLEHPVLPVQALAMRVTHLVTSSGQVRVLPKRLIYQSLSVRIR